MAEKKEVDEKKAKEQAKKEAEAKRQAEIDKNAEIAEEKQKAKDKLAKTIATKKFKVVVIGFHRYGKMFRNGDVLDGKQYKNDILNWIDLGYIEEKKGK